MLGGVLYGLFAGWGTVRGEPIVPDYLCTDAGLVSVNGTLAGYVGVNGTEAGRAGCC